MLTTLTRILKFGWQNFRRNSWLSIATISIMILTLVVFQGLILFHVFTGIALENLKDKIDISIYFASEAGENDILKIQKNLEKRNDIKQVEYISREKALALFKERHKDDPTINQALQELEANPLSSSLNIKAKNPADYSVIAAFLDQQFSWQPIIEKMTYRQNQLVIERLSKIVDTAEKSGFGLTIFLSLAAVLVTFNTISLSIYSNRDEIGIMRLVGSSNQFIVGPYIITGIIYSIIAAVISFLIIWPVIALISPYLKFIVSETNFYDYFTGHFWGLLGYTMLFGMALGIVSSQVAIRKYLKI